ncbi:vacuolar-processing enzyme-like isoform X1 [Rhodamnia argentea]|uniref:Vacuolar-processing enzyme-like isoform X1 n=1 Tax=Rhodamnia argentea TaxID=178133 RepID=A0ABM3HTL8_9MYRT|nr:vacuolar-processing enzyme-like isoform X1 [Rhodamnia argentea]XP_048139927.1 vacuolar-processing enzyme-like isoform X1 [Rhodamnia argentea]
MMSSSYVSLVPFLLLLLTALMMAAVSESRRSFQEILLQSGGESTGTQWAILVAGSKGYSNYRHQADVCHAYQILKVNGLKDENIIVFMYDDIAGSKYNPTKGIIINKPNGPDVYHGVPKDYTGDATTAANLYAVLLGNKMALSGGSGKVLNSGANDHVFFYYADHGSPGLLGMPVGNNIYANDLMNVLKQMYKMKKYMNMVIYIEACESGSMLQGLLPKDMGIYATTASNAKESSWGYYCPGDTTDGDPSKYDTCLGDLYSIAWMEDSDANDLGKETLQDQYLTVKKRTSLSHVMQYGNTVLSQAFLSTYMGQSPKKVSSVRLDELSSSTFRAVPQRDADLVFFQRQVQKAPKGSAESVEAQKRLDEQIARRSHVDRSINQIVYYLFGGSNAASMLTAVRPEERPVVDNWDCLKTFVRTYEQYCGRLSEYGMQYTRAMANMCNAGVDKDRMVAASIQACSGKA